MVHTSYTKTFQRYSIKAKSNKMVQTLEVMIITELKLNNLKN